MYKKPSSKRSNNLLPDYIAENISKVDFTYLQSTGIKAFLVDLDHTVVHYGTETVEDWVFEALKNQPLPFFVATNRPKSKDVSVIVKALGAQGAMQPEGLKGKPLPAYYRRSEAETGYTPSELIMVGDRFIQDIYGANKAGMTTLAVEKFGPVTGIDKFFSFIEIKIMKHLKRTYKKVK